MKEEEAKCRIRLSVSGTFLPALADLLQRGVRVRARVGVPVRVFLTRELGIDPGYVEDAIQTVFLDGSPVDDIDAATVPDGARLALAASMPGLVGISMRRNSPGSFIRSGISHRAAPAGDEEKEGLVLVCLYNLVQRDLARDFLERGFFLEASMLAEFFLRNPEVPGTGRMEVNNVETGRAEVLALLEGQGVAPVFFSARFDNGGVDGTGPKE
ncbi:MAG: hypothetical protein ACLFOY_15780 [Desulfatibacillaceae bacterium]